jgi:signal transduction histidine kinase
VTAPPTAFTRLRLALRSWLREERRPLPPNSHQQWLWGASAAALLGLTGLTFTNLLEQRHQLRLAERQEALTLLRYHMQLTLQTVFDWGHWTEMYNYAASPRRGFVEVDILRAAMLKDGGVMLAFNHRHQLLFSADRQGMNRSSHRPLVQCLQPILEGPPAQLQQQLLLCEGEKGVLYGGGIGRITDSASKKPANGTLAFLMPVLSPDQLPRNQRLLDQLMGDLQPAPGKAAPRLWKELNLPLLNQEQRPLTVMPLSVWESAAIPLRNTLLVLAMGSGGALLVRLLWMLERRRQRLEKCRQESSRRTQQRRRQSEQQRLQIEQQLTSSLTAAVVAHEIQQPLSTILLHSRMALRELDGPDGPPDQAEGGLQTQLAWRLEAMNSEAQRAAKITERMRMLLRNVNTPHSPVNLVAVVESCLLFFKRAIHQHGIALTTEGLDGELRLDGDATQLQSAINNLIQNAIDALVPQPPGQQRRLHVSLMRGACQVRLSIADSGAGFPEQPPAVPLASSKPQGCGLGLFVVRTTIQHHGGCLSFGRSADLGGAEVVLTLPLPPRRSAA